MEQTTFYIVVVVLLAIIIFLFMKNYGVNKWQCSENGWEQTLIGGSYNTKGECEQTCEDDTSWDCVNQNGVNKCLPNESGNGKYNSQAGCAEDCVNNVAHHPYIPQSLYPIRGWRRFGRFGRRFGGRRRHHRAPP